MAFAFMVLLLLISFAAFVFKKRRASFAFMTFTAAWVLFVGCGLLPALLLRHLQTRDPLSTPEWKTKNAIVVLGGGGVRWPQADQISSTLLGYSRVYETTRLYYSCKTAATQCHVLLSGGDPAKYGLSESEIMARELRDVGVANADIILETKSNNTFQNAEFSSEILRSNRFDQFVLVTSGTHMTRALLYFSHFKIEPVAAPSDHLRAHLSPLPSAFNFTTADIALHEYAGILRFHVYNLLGWNKASTAPGAA